MTPETERFLDKARDLLVQDAIMLDASLNDAAGRTAYLAGFHAAQAFVFEHTGQARKTHSGAKAEFPRLTKDDPGLAPALSAFLPRTYNLNAIADYETGPGSKVSANRAAETIEAGKRFMAQIIKLLAIDYPYAAGPPSSSVSNLRPLFSIAVRCAAPVRRAT